MQAKKKNFSRHDEGVIAVTLALYLFDSFRWHQLYNNNCNTKTTEQTYCNLSHVVKDVEPFLVR